MDITESQTNSRLHLCRCTLKKSCYMLVLGEFWAGLSFERPVRVNVARFNVSSHKMLSAHSIPCLTDYTYIELTIASCKTALFNIFFYDQLVLYPFWSTRFLFNSSSENCNKCRLPHLLAPMAQAKSLSPKSIYFIQYFFPPVKRKLQVSLFGSWSQILSLTCVEWIWRCGVGHDKQILRSAWVGPVVG